uniref:Ribosomal protein L1 n=1 Tax=Plectus sambesii TaxID=2011161 RepID=A0A914WQV5_9BILA
MAVEKKEEVKGGVPKAENKGQARTARALKKKGVATRRESQDKIRTDATHFNLDAQGRTAIKALQKYYNEQKSQSKSALFPEIDFSLHLMAVYKKAARVTPDKTSAYRKIELPFPLQSPATSTVCLIVRDLHMKDKEYNDPDVDKQAREWQEKLLIEQNITSAQITKILTRRQLEREYHTFADKRSLASAYDLFLVDNTVMKAVHDICGKEFHKAKKYPIAVKTNRPLAPQISKAFRITLMPVFKLKNRVSIKIGHLGQPLDELVKNMNECIVQLRHYCPGGTANIQSLYLQPTTSTPSLPIHASLGNI